MTTRSVRRPPLAAALLTCALLLLIPEPAAAETSTAGVDEAIGRARSLIAAGEPEEALDILRELPRQGPRRISILFQTGLAAMAAARKEGLVEKDRTALLDEAIAALRAILIDRPDLVRVRLELARAFFLKGDDDLARQHFEQVLAGDPPLAVALNVQRFLHIMRARRRWTAYVGAAIAPDTNINSASENRYIYLDTLFGRLRFARSRESLARSGVGLSI